MSRRAQLYWFQVIFENLDFLAAKYDIVRAVIPLYTPVWRAERADTKIQKIYMLSDSEQSDRFRDSKPHKIIT